MAVSPAPALEAYPIATPFWLLAVALTPPTPCAKETVGYNNDSTNVLIG